MPEENDERRERSERALTEHDRVMERNAAHSARDVLHDSTPFAEAGSYTTYEARDRAAHTPSVLERDLPRDREEEARMIDALHKDLFPTEKDWQDYRQADAPASPALTWEQPKNDFQAATTAEKPAKETKETVTPDQQASVDKALKDADISDKIGGASDAGAKPTPNEPTPLDKSRDIGQDLHKQGVTMDRE